MNIGVVIPFPGSAAAHQAQAAASAAAQAAAQPALRSPEPKSSGDCEDCQVDSRSRPLLDARSQLLAQEAAGEARRAGRIAAQEAAGGTNRAQQPAPQPSGGSEDEVPGQLSEAEQKQVAELKRVDAEVRRHEQAHAAAGGQYAGSPNYEYTAGPDGRRYATSGHVQIDVSPIANDPKATIAKMDQVRKAAMAPAEPSSQDRAVAAKATQEKVKAQAELAQQSAEERASIAGPEADDGTDIGTLTAASSSGQAALGESPAGRDGPSKPRPQPTIDIGSLFGITA